MIKKTTLCYIEKNDCFLMLFRNKKKNDPSEGKWVGVGGKFEPREDATDCLMREVYEETGLTLKKYHFHGVVHFISDVLDDEDMYLFTATEYDGDDPAADKNAFECDEGELCWIDKHDVLSLNLWEGDRYFLEYLIKGRDFDEMTCIYSGDRLIRAEQH